MTNGGFACAWQQGRGLPRRGERKEAGSQGDSHGSGKKRRLNFFYFLFFIFLPWQSPARCQHSAMPGETLSPPSQLSLTVCSSHSSQRGFAITCESGDGGQWKRVLLGQESGHFLSLGASPMEALWATSAEEDIAGVRNTYTARILVGPHHSAGMCDKLGQWLFPSHCLPQPQRNGCEHGQPSESMGGSHRKIQQAFVHARVFWVINHLFLILKDVFLLNRCVFPQHRKKIILDCETKDS